jgi:SAM-dependent methyltransferase
MKLSAAEKARFESYVKEATEAAFRGWDFSYMAQYGGDDEEPKPWSYPNEVRRYLPGKDIILDMGTGGGEFLATLQPLPAQTYATEAYRPNVPVAKARLEPLGVTVVELENEDARQEDGSVLPFEDAFFEVIINRHEAYDSKEVHRILQPGGVFITQQVGQRNCENLRMIFGSPEDYEDFEWDVATCQRFLEDAGLTVIDAKEHIGYSRMYDIRALVYLLRVIPWDFPNFDPERYAPQLLNIYIKILEDGFIDATLHRFIVIARKP